MLPCRSQPHFAPSYAATQDLIYVQNVPSVGDTNRRALESSQLRYTAAMKDTEGLEVRRSPCRSPSPSPEPQALDDEEPGSPTVEIAVDINEADRLRRLQVLPSERGKIGQILPDSPGCQSPGATVGAGEARGRAKTPGGPVGRSTTAPVRDLSSRERRERDRLHSELEQLQQQRHGSAPRPNTPRCSL